MGFGDTRAGKIDQPDSRNTDGQWKAEWHVANDDLSTANTDALLNLGTSTSYTAVYPIEIPYGARRCWVRMAAHTDTTTTTTDPVVYLVAADSNGVPRRIDNADPDGTGVTLALSNSSSVSAENPQADTKYWSPVKGGDDGYLLNGESTLYMLVATAGAYTDGSSATALDGYVMFGN